MAGPEAHACFVLARVTMGAFFTAVWSFVARVAGATSGVRRLVVNVRIRWTRSTFLIADIRFRGPAWAFMALSRRIRIGFVMHFAQTLVLARGCIGNRRLVFVTKLTRCATHSGLVRPG